VANKKQPQCAAQAKKHKAFFIFRVIGIVDQLGALIDEDGLGFVEAHAVLLGVRSGFAFVPLKAKCAHAGSVTTL
jgi:hypothetical protein